MDKAVEALLLVREAREQGGRRLPPRLISWLWAGEAETAAAAGFTADALRALDNADATLPAEAADPELPYLSLDECHLARWRGSTLARLGSADAIYQLERSLDRIGAEYNRARGGLHLDLAQALIYAGAPDTAANHLAQGHDLAIQIGSVRQQQRLLKLAA